MKNVLEGCNHVAIRPFKKVMEGIKAFRNGPKEIIYSGGSTVPQKEQGYLSRWKFTELLKE
jgi:hypothetical protein